MKIAGRYVVFAALLAGTVAVPLAAAPADQVRARVAGLRALGAAFKQMNDGLRAPTPDLVALRGAAKQISTAAHDMPRWFPAGSGASATVKTAAKPEIWSQPAQFRVALTGFTTQAAAVQRAAAAGDIEAIRAESRKLGGTCKACHDNFRVPKE